MTPVRCLALKKKSFTPVAWLPWATLYSASRSVNDARRVCTSPDDVLPEMPAELRNASVVAASFSHAVNCLIRSRSSRMARTSCPARLLMSTAATGNPTVTTFLLQFQITARRLLTVMMFDALDAPHVADTPIAFSMVVLNVAAVVRAAAVTGIGASALNAVNDDPNCTWPWP